MPFKYAPDGSLVTADVDGKKAPVFVYPDGREIPFNADQAVSKIAELNRESQERREAAEAAAKKLAAFADLDPEAARKALSTVKNLDDKKLVEAGEVERIKAEAIKSVEAQYAPFKTKAEQLQSLLDSKLVEGVFSNSKFVATRFAAENAAAAAQIARSLFGSRFKVDGEKVYAVDESGQKIYSRARPGEIADPEEAIQLIAESSPLRGSILKGSGGSGGGASNSAGGGGGKRTMTRAEFNALTPAEQGKTARDPNVQVTDA